eukprot:TRINITY_DN10248_c0_g1_i1.p1 TRINITY_DN10248_c0_g1~~TRINITY_DN10248_c0_g1_i1.p1  ORF type:complete len:250 (-),score=55.75 TRINITY_DN10248_c0_g1_i1:196-945(-)
MSRHSLKTLLVFCLLEKFSADPISFPNIFSNKIVKEHKTLNEDEGLNKYVKIGELSTLHHEVRGEVFILDEKTLVVKNFNYDGVAPDAFFLVGTEGTPGNDDESKMAILAHPFEGNHYQYRDEEAPVLKAAVDEDVVLTLPPHMKVSDLKWISVWCRKFSVDFGNLIFHSEPEVNCDDYSFNFEHKTGVISAFKTKEENNTTDTEKLPGPCEITETQECETEMEEECTEEIIEECETENEEKCENVLQW